MITINNNSGELHFSNWTLSPKTKLNDIKKIFSSKELELWGYSSDQCVTYRLKISDEYILIVTFLSDAINRIEIYPRNIAEDKMPFVLRDILENLGGARIYPWGKIQLKNDVKAGYDSVLISYH